jgi:hypothetical protein
MNKLTLDIPIRPNVKPQDTPLFLTAPVACQIEDALRRVGDFGEVRLVVVKGHLRFIQVMRSEDVTSTDK